MRVLSLGAGVQSTALLFLALTGEMVEPIDHAIFADTGWEPAAVYKHLELLKVICKGNDVPLHVVQDGDIRSMDGFGKGSALDAPWFLTNKDGRPGMARRQCTSRLKITPIRRKIRELRDEAGVKHVTQLFGISADEIQRMRDSDVKYITHEYPLVDAGWTRNDCAQYLARGGITAPRSACIGCPYHSNAEWRDMKLNRPGEFREAVEWERQAQEHGLQLDAVPYAHAQRVPLDQVGLSNLEDLGQLTMLDECEGMCGV